MSYINELGLYDVDPNTDGKPTSNDGWILTAYAQKLGLPVDKSRLILTKEMLTTRADGLPIERLPNKQTPFLSRDVILGLVALKLISVSQLEKANWNFSPFKLPKFNLFKLISQLYQLKGKHRNHFWQNKGFEQVYYTAFSVPLTDRAFLYQASGKPVPMIYRLISWFDSKLKPKSNSGALIRWLKYDNIPDKKVFEEYFGTGHPFLEKI